MTYLKCYYTNIRFVFICMLFFCCFNFINLSFASEENNVASKLSKCATCHTLSGNSIVSMWPKLAEQHASYMVKQLFEFKKGKAGDRFDPTMFGMLQDVTEDELLELAEHFSKQVLEKGKAKVDDKQFEIGKNIYLYGNKYNKTAGCFGCHGLDGTGNKLANYPSLKWQHKEYLMTQLKKFKSGDRSNDVNSIMRDVTSNLSNEEINAVAAYISLMD